jgi:hypothetical protein
MVRVRQKARVKAKAKSKRRRKQTGLLEMYVSFIAKGIAHTNPHQDGVLVNLDWSGHHANKTLDKFHADRKAQNIVWSRKPPEDNGVVWNGAAMLGAGSFGAAFAFYCENASGLVSDRIAMKDTVVPRQNWVSLDAYRMVHAAR